jgi:hypothetical protein
MTAQDNPVRSVPDGAGLATLDGLDFRSLRAGTMVSVDLQMWEEDVLGIMPLLGRSGDVMETLKIMSVIVSLRLD